MSKNSAILSIIVALAIIVLVQWLFVLCPINYNPDASAYFGIALRIKRGALLNAVHLMHSPLFSACIALISLLGFSLYSAFQVFTGILFAAIFLATMWLARALGCSFFACLVISLLVVLQLIPFALLTITPDVLVVLIVELIFLFFIEYERTAKRSYLVVRGFSTTDRES